MAQTKKVYLLSDSEKKVSNLQNVCFIKHWFLHLFPGIILQIKIVIAHKPGQISQLVPGKISPVLHKIRACLHMALFQKSSFLTKSCGLAIPDQFPMPMLWFQNKDTYT